MKYLYVMLLFLFAACSDSSRDTDSTSETLVTSTVKESESLPTITKPVLKENDSILPGTKTDKEYANTRFRKVTVVKLTEGSYRIRGEAQIFEASFGWIIEDGHNELKEGYSTTDAGAPEWGKFDFSVNVSKARENSVLHLILFETSAKDGSRQHQLSIPLT